MNGLSDPQESWLASWVRDVLGGMGTSLLGPLPLEGGGGQSPPGLVPDPPGCLRARSVLQPPTLSGFAPVAFLPKSSKQIFSDSFWTHTEKMVHQLTFAISHIHTTDNVNIEFVDHSKNHSNWIRDSLWHSFSWHELKTTTYKLWRNETTRKSCSRYKS